MQTNVPPPNSQGTSTEVSDNFPRSMRMFGGNSNTLTLGNGQNTVGIMGPSAASIFPFPTTLRHIPLASLLILKTV